MTNMPFIADPSDPGIGVDDDLGVAAAEGHTADSVTVNGTEVGEASEDDVASFAITTETLEAAAEGDSA